MNLEYRQRGARLPSLTLMVISGTIAGVRSAGNTAERTGGGVKGRPVRLAG